MHVDYGQHRVWYAEIRDRDPGYPGTVILGPFQDRGSANDAMRTELRAVQEGTGRVYSKTRGI